MCPAQNNDTFTLIEGDISCGTNIIWFTLFNRITDKCLTTGLFQIFDVSHIEYE